MRPFLIPMLLAAVSTAYADPSAFGWVLELHGTWADRAAHNAPVRKNYPVSSRSRLICTDRDNKPSYLVIKSRLNGNTKRFSCEDGVTCDRDLDLEPLVPPEGR